MPSTIVSWTPDPLLRSAAAPRVWTKQNWGDDWTERPHLYCDGFVLAASPEIPRASLSWRYGEILQADGVSFATVDPLVPDDEIGCYLKLELDDPTDDDNTVTWYGVIDELDDDRGGSPVAFGSDESDDVVRTGRQVLTALGLEILLERQIIEASWIDGSPEYPVARAIMFNQPIQQTHQDIGNRSRSPGNQGAYVFTAAYDGSSAFWSTADICEYLLAYLAPENAAHNQPLPWQLSEDSFPLLFHWDQPRLVAEKRSLKQLLDQLVDRRRILGYSIAVTDDESAVEMRVFSFNQTDLTFGGYTLPANANQLVIDIDNSPDAESVVVRRTAVDMVDQVICVGDRAIACFTIAGADGTLDAGWSDDDQTDYNSAASEEDDYPTDRWEQELRNLHYRAQDRLKRVYAYFGLFVDWDGMVGDGEGGDVHPYYPGGGPGDLVLQPDEDNEGDDPDLPPLPLTTDSSDPEPFWLAGLRFERTLPLRLNHDYSGSNIASGAVTDTTPSGQAWEYLPMFAVAKIPQDASTLYGDPHRYEYLEKFSQAAALESANSPFAAAIRPQEDFPGLILDMEGLRELCAKADFSPCDDGDSDAHEGYPAFNWRTDLIATVAVRCDAFCRQVWPDDDSVDTTPDTVRRLVIDVGAEAQLHYVAPGTVVAVDDGNLVKSTSGGPIRDDRPRLQEIARFAYEWSGQFRQVLDISLRLPAFGLQIGQLITALVDERNDASEPINTVITRIEYRFPEQAGSQPPMPTTHITTGYGQVDGLARSVKFSSG